MNRIHKVMNKRAAGEKGFTLIELLVVVVILVVLAAIAVPIFLNQASKARQAKAQSNVATVAGALANGRATSSDAVVAASVLSVTSADSGDIQVNLGGAAIAGGPTGNTGYTTKAAISTYCVSQSEGGTTYYMGSGDSAPNTTACNQAA